MLTERTAQELASTGRLINVSAERSLHEVTSVATRGVPGCAAAGVVVWDAGDVRETAASHPDIGTLFEFQEHHGAGPVLEAQHRRQPVFVQDTLTEQRWPRYAFAAVRFGVRSTLVLPLEVDNTLVTFALHSARPRAWEERAVLPLTSLLAAQIAVVLGNVGDYEDASHAAGELRRAISHQAEIDQAKGILARTGGYPQREALEELGRRARRARVSVSELARQIVTSYGFRR